MARSSLASIVVLLFAVAHLASAGASGPASSTIVELDDLKLEAERHSKRATISDNRASVKVEGKITALPQAPPPLAVDTQVEPNPAVASINPPVLPWYGGSKVEILGDHFGTNAKIGVQITVDGKPCKASHWVSRHKVVCEGLQKMPLHQEVEVIVVVGGDADSEPFVAKVGPNVEKIVPAEAPSYGGFWVEVRGHNFGLKENHVNPAAVTVGDKPCRETKWKSERILKCLTPELEAGEKEVKAVVEGHSSNVTVGAKVLLEDPVIFAVIPNNGPSYGGSTIIIEGKHLGLPHGPLSMEPTAFINGVPCVRTQRDPDNTSHVHCVLPPNGKAGDATVELRLGKNTTARLDEGMFTLEDMKVTAVVPASKPLFSPRTGVPLIIKGEQLALDGLPAPTVDLDGIPCGELKVHSVREGAVGTGTREHKEIHCWVPVEKGLGGKVEFTVSNGAGRAEGVFEFTNTPTITAIKPSPAPIGYKGEVKIYGRNFGVAKQPFATRLGINLCEDPVRTDYGVSCQITGRKHPDRDGSGGTEVKLWPTWHKDMSNEEAGVPSVNLIAVDTPEITFLEPKTIQSSGGQNITLRGKNLGGGLFVPNVLIGGKRCLKVRKIRRGELTCVAPAGSLGPADVEVKLRGVAGKMAKGLTYVAPVVSSIHPPAGPEYGHTHLSIRGAGLGWLAGKSDTRAFVDGRPCYNTIIKRMDEIVCLTPPGEPGEMGDVTVMVNGIKNTEDGGADGATEKFAYQDIESNRVVPGRGATYGQNKVVIYGLNVGDNATSGLRPTAFIGKVPCSTTKWLSADSIECTTPPGTGTQPVSLRVNGKVSSDNETFYEYVEPMISRVSPAAGGLFGGDELVISGNFLGTDTAKPVITVGGQVCIAPVVDIPHRQVKCVVPVSKGPGKVDVVVAVNGVRSNLTAFSKYDYVDSVVNTVEPREGPTYGGVELTISGHMLGVQGRVPKVFVGELQCSDVELVSNSVLKCTSPRGTPGDASVKVMYGGVYGTEGKNLYKFVGPEVGMVVPAFGPAFGGAELTIVGTDLGGENERPIVMVGNAGCTNVQRISDKRITCVAPPGYGSVAVTVSVGGTKSDDGHLGNFTYEAPAIESLLPSEGAPAGGNLIMIQGNHLMANSNASILSTVVEIDGKACYDVKAIDPHRVTCRAPSTKRGGRVQVTVRIGSAMTTSAYTYLVPTVSSIEPEQIPNYGGSIITIRGRYYGEPKTKLEREAIVAYVGGKKCEKTTLISPVEIQCVTPVGPGAGTKASVNVNYFEAKSVDNKLATFRAPFIKKVVPSHVPRDQPSRVEIEGRFLGNDRRLTHVTVGGDPCTDVRVDSDHLISCLIAPGPSGKMDVSVRVSKDVGTAEGLLWREDVRISIREVKPRHISFWLPHEISVRIKTTGIHPNTLMNVSLDGKVCNSTGYPQKVREIPNSEYDERWITCMTRPFKGPTGPGKLHIRSSFTDMYGVVHSAETNKTHFDVSAPITKIVPESLAFYGGELVTFHQTELDTVDDLSKVKSLSVRIGTETCKNLKRDGNTYTCVAPKGPPGKVPVVITRNFISEAQIGMVHFDGPLVRTVVPNLGPTFGETRLRIEGRHFGTNENHAITVKVGGKFCLNVNRTSPDTLYCETPEGAVIGKVPVSVKSEGVDSLVNGEFEYIGPNEKRISPPMGPIYGGETIQIYGSGFGNKDLATTVVAFIGGKPCLKSVWVSDEEVSCVTPSGSEGPASVKISVGKRMFELQAKFHYIRGVVTHVHPKSGPMYGGEDIIVGGMYAIPSNWIPKKAMKVAIAVGGSPCVNPEIVGTAGKLNWKCTTTKGMGKGQQITMVINGAPSRNTSKMQYDYVTPDITSIQPSSGPFYGNWTISIRGKYLGKPALSKHTDVTIGNALCKDVKIVSDTEIQCTAPQLPPKDKYPVMITMHKQYSGTPFSGLDFTTPKVDSAEPAVGATYGGTKVVFSGTGMGTASLIQSGALQVYVAGSPCTTLKLIQDNGAKSSVECEVPSADGEKFFEHVPIEVKMGDVVGKTDGVFGYRAPVVMGIDPPAAALYGGETIKITGKYFGTKKNPPTAIIGRTMCIKTEWLSDESITCIVPPASNPNTKHYSRNVIVTVNDHTDASNLKNKLLAYQPSKITSVTPARGSVTGKSKVVIRGSNLGDEKRPPIASIGGFKCAKTTFVSSNEVICITPPSLYVGKANVSVSVFGFQSNKLKFTYDGPHVFAIKPKHGPTYGGNLVHVTGKNFGDPVKDADVPVLVFIGNRTCSNPRRLSQTELTCIAPAGTARDNVVRVHVGITKGLSHGNATYHYRIPFVQCVDKAHGELFGGDQVNILGRDFGRKESKPLAFIGGVQCAETKFVSEHRLVCKLPAAAGRTDFQNKSVVVTSLDASHPGERHAYHFTYSGGMNKIFSYDDMVLQTISDKDGPTYGYNKIVVTGKNIATPESSAKPDVYVGENKCLSTTVLGNDELECVVPPGAGTNVSVSTRYFNVTSLPSKLVYSYEAPMIERVKGQDIGASYGGSLLVIEGRNLGNAEHAIPVVHVGPNLCKNVTVIDDTTVQCTTSPGTDANLTVSLSVDGVKNVKADETFKFSYKVPVIEDLLPAEGMPWYGNESLKIFGKFLGSRAMMPKVTIGGVPCLKLTLKSDEELHCVVPPGRGSQPLVVSVSGFPSRENTMLNYLPPLVTKLSPAYGPAYGNASVAIIGQRLVHPRGEKLGPAYATEVSVGGRDCITVKVMSPTKVVCQLPSTKKAGATDVEVSAFGSTSAKTNQTRFTYEPPKVYQMLPTHGKFYGNTNITLVGVNFGNHFTKTKVLVDDVPCRHIKLVSAHMITCNTPPGTNPKAPVKVYVSGTSSSGKHMFSYDNSTQSSFNFDPPRVTGVYPLEGGAIGHEEITISGHLFGKAGDEVKPIALIGGKPCIKTTWVSESKLKCVTPAARLSHEVIVGEKVLFPASVSVIIRGMPSDPEVGIDQVAYGYHRPRVMKVLPNEGPSYGRQTVRVLGMRFGPGPQEGSDILKPTVLIGGLPCLSTKYVDDMELECESPPGRGNRSVAVEINGVLSVTSHVEPTWYKFLVPVVTGAFLDDPRKNSTTIVDVMNATNSSNTTLNITSVPFVPRPTKTLPVYGGVTFFISGKYFGSRASDMPVATVGGRPCKETEWISDTLIKCVSPAVKSGMKMIGVMVGPSASKRAGAPEVKTVLPRISSLDHFSGPELGGDVVTVNGNWLGGYGVPKEEVVVAFGGVPCRRTISVSDKKAICHTAPGFGSVYPTIVVRGHSSKAINASNASTYSGNLTNVRYTFAKLRVTGMPENSGPTKGGVSRVIVGEGIPLNGSVGVIGGKSCIASRATSSRTLECVLPAGVGMNHTVEIRAGKESSALRGTDVTFDYDRPVIDQAVLEGPKGGNAWVNVTGRNFGVNGSKPIVLLGGEPCNASKRVSHEMVRCLIPPGAGRRTINVDVLGRNATTGGKFIYTPAMVTSVEHRHGPTAGGWKLVIRGEGFGASAKDLQSAAEEGKKVMEEEKSEEEQAREAEKDELAKAKADSEKALADAMGEDAQAMMQLKNQTDSMAEEERAELKNENATAQKLRSAEQAEELAEVSNGMEELKKTESAVKNEKAANKLNGDISMRQAEIAKAKLDASLKEVRAKAESEEKKEVESEDDVDNSAQKSAKNAAVEAELTKVQAQAANESVVSSDLADASAVAFLEVERVSRRNRKHANRKVQTLDPSENIYEIQRAAPRRRKIGRRVQQKNNASKYGVWVGGKPCRNVTWVSDKQVECIVPPGAGDAKIVVRAPADQGVAARGANLTIEYDGPVIRMIGPNSGENGGAYDMEILGKNFGEVKPKSIVAFVGEAKCLKTTWFSDAMIVCRVPPSTGTNEKVTVVVNGKKSAIGKVGALPFKPAFFSYEAPVVASVLPKDGPAVGGVRITVKGTGFGYKLRKNLKEFGNSTNATLELEVLVGAKECLKVKLVSDTELKCTTPSGLGSRKVAVVVNGQSSEVEGPTATGATGGQAGATGASASTGATGGVQDAEDYFHTHSPSVSGVKPPYSLGEGGRKLSLRGENFGDANNTHIVVKVDGEEASNVRVINDNLLTCLSPAGSGANVSVQVYVDGKTNKSFDFFEYDPPLVASSRPKASVSGEKLTISGHNFGAMDHKIKAFIGDVPCGSVERIGEDSIRCVVPVGVGKDLPVRLLIHGRNGVLTPASRNATFSYPPPAVTSVRPRAISTKGEMVDIIGHGFGGKPNGNITGIIGDKPCRHTEWVSSKLIHCYAPHGAGKNLTVSVYLGNGAVTKPRKLIDYKHPVITSIEPNHGPGSGDTGIVRIVATELGDLLDNENITMKVNGGVAKLQKFNRTVTIGGKPCKIVKVTKNTIECKVPKGIGYDLPVVISVEGEDSPPGIYSYDGPSVLNVVPSVVPAAGGERITVIGTSFGEKTASAAMEVIVGGKVCKNATWVNDTSISCVSPPGIGKSRPVVVVVKGQPSRDYLAFSYAHPSVMSVSPRVAVLGAKQVKLQIRGKNFGKHASPLSITVGLQKCTKAIFYNDTHVDCVLPEVKAGKFSVQITVAGQTSIAQLLFKSVPPTITSVSPTSGSTAGGYKINIVGTGFVPGANQVVTLGKWLCTDVVVSSESTLSCKVPKGSAGVQNITVLVNGNPSKPSTDFAYNSPSVANIQPAHGKPVGGTKVVIQGKDFGFRRPVPGALVASIGGRKCLKTTWKSDSEVECVAPEGTGSCKAVTVRVGARDSQVSASNTLWHYEDAPDATKTHVLRLNPGNFDEIVNGDRPVMINFCTRGCEVCQKLKPVYEEIARMLTCKSVVIATVRVDQHPSLAKRFSLKDTFPRMLFFSEGRTTPSAEFNGKLVAENILGFMARQMRLGAGAEDEPVNALQPVVDGFVVGQPNQGMKRCSKMETVQVNSPPILPMKRL